MGISPPSYGNQPTFLWESAHLFMGISPPSYGNQPTFSCDFEK